MIKRKPWASVFQVLNHLIQRDAVGREVGGIIAGLVLPLQGERDGIDFRFRLGHSDMRGRRLFDGDGSQQTVLVGGINQQVVGLLLTGIVGVIRQEFFAMKRMLRIFQNERIILPFGQFVFVEFLELFQYIVHVHDVGLAFHLYAFLTFYGRQDHASCFQLEVGACSVVGGHSVMVA